MEYDFDNIVNRRGTDSVKWNGDVIESICSNRHADAFWVADMDFETAPSIKETAKKVADLALFGYPMENPITSIFSSWCEKRHDWKIDESKSAFVSGLLHGIALAIDLFTKEGDKLLIPSPTYRPFMEISKDNDRIMLDLPLRKRGDGTFYLDRKDFKASLNEAALVLFCSPHNPSGLVFSHDDLIFILTEAKKQNKIVISDEIHADLTHDGVKHIPMGKANEEVGASVITFMAPSKTFNLAGEHAGFAVFSDSTMFDAFTRKQRALRVVTPGYTIKQLMSAAYLEAYDYNKALCKYLKDTASAMKEYLASECPALKIANADASFVTFIDCSEVYDKIESKVLSDTQKYKIANGGGILSTFFGVEAGVCMNDGTWFGPAYKQYVRINYGTSRELTLDALKRIVSAIKAL